MLEARGVELSYRVAAAEGSEVLTCLSGASLSVAAGEVVALVGANGAGKSSLARVLCGSLEPQSGTLALDGEVVPSSRLREAVGFVRQDPESQLVAPTVFDEVAFGPCNLGIPEAEVRARAAEALGQCGLAGFDDRLVSELSGGELQRLAIAGVLAMHPRYLVLDEVTSQLDGTARAQIRGIVRSRAAEGVGVLMVTHDVEELAAAHRVALMRDGSIVWEGTPVDLLCNEDLLDALGLSASRTCRACALLARHGYAFGGAATGERLDARALAAFAAQQGLEEELAAVLRPAERRGTSGGASSPALVLDHASVRYGEQTALDDVTLRCAPGRVTLVAGPSGSGKSTAAAVAAGILEPDAGAAWLEGAERVPVRPGSVGLCLQRAEDQLFCDTVIDDVAFGPTNLGVPSDQAKERAERALKALGLDEGLWTRSPFALSGGQRRRAALAGIVALEPEALVLDEPTVGLDAEGRAVLHEVVRSLARGGRAVMVVSHDVGEWLDVADDIALVVAGRLAWAGSVSQLVDEPGRLEVAGVAGPLWLRLREALASCAAENGAEDGADVAFDGGASAAGCGVSAEFEAGVGREGCIGLEAAASRDGRVGHGPAASHEATDRGPSRRPARRGALLGSYVAADTPVHRLDARVKLVVLLAATVALFATSQPVLLAVMAVCVVAFARLGGVGVRALVSGLKPTAVILAFSLLANALVLDGTGDLALLGSLGVSFAGVARGVVAVTRIAVLVGASLVVTSTTSSTAVADAFASLMAPLGRLGAPTGDIAMIVSVALRFIPLTAEELLRIRDAQRARGVDFSSGSVLVRVRRWLSVLTPLVVALFRRADDLAAAMRERCYRGEGRTRFAHPLRPADVVVLVVGLVACVAACVA